MHHLSRKSEKEFCLSLNVMSFLSPMWLQSILTPSEFCVCQHRFTYNHNKEDLVWSPKCDIFVSSSTTQDWFVAQLCEDLRRRNRVPFFEAQDARMSTSNIEEYEFCHPDIAKFKMVVVVVSEEYCTSSCKLTQLHHIMKASVTNENLKILPLFFGLNVDEICNRQEGWFKVLEETTTFNASWPNKLDDWKQSLKLILGFNGLVYNQDSKLEGLVAYRKEIVSNICKVVPPTMSHLDELCFHERSQLCKVILMMVFPKLAHVTHC